MKKSLIIFTFLLTFSYVNAQENKFAVKRASNAVSEQTQFIEKTLYTKYAENALKIKGNNLSQEEKKEVYSNAAAATRKLLRQEFSKEEVMSIIRLERQSFKK
jgi:hypothetical protein